MAKGELKIFSEQYNQFIEQFGHLGDSGNDFSIPPWRETPDVILKMITSYEPAIKNQASKVNLQDLRDRNVVNPIFTLFLKQTREFQYLRERSSNLYTRGKVLFRIYYLALANYLISLNLIDSPEDIFYLTPEQVKSLSLNEGKYIDARTVIAKHKLDMECLKNVKLPSVIYGDEPPPMCESDAHILLGVPVSLGVYTGRICVVKSEADFDKLKQGEVLVIPYSDVSWSPIFARAGALISESGGLLSHGSIVAREYNLPAIVSVEHATTLKDGTLVRVDAQQGVIQLI